LKEYLEFVGADAQRNTADSKKFWEVEVVGKKAFSRYGRIGSKGTKTVKEFPDKAAALAFAEKALAEKIKKGYSRKKTKQSQGEKVSPKETEPISLTFEYAIGFSWYYEDSQPYDKVPLTLEDKRERIASDFVRDAIKKGAKPKVDIISKGRLVATIESSEIEYVQDEFQWEPCQDVRYFMTSHVLSGKNSDWLKELVERYEASYDKEILQARVRIGNYTFMHHNNLWESDWKATKKVEFSKFENNCTILATMWFAMQDDDKYTDFRDLNEISSPFDVRDDEEFRDLLEDHKPGLMAAYLVDVGHIEASKSATALIESTYNSIAKFLGVPSKKAFETFQEMIEAGK
jgi:predicted DNA-binding WGR domain protein